MSAYQRESVWNETGTIWFSSNSWGQRLFSKQVRTEQTKELLNCVTLLTTPVWCIPQVNRLTTCQDGDRDQEEGSTLAVSVCWSCQWRWFHQLNFQLVESHSPPAGSGWCLSVWLSVCLGDWWITNPKPFLPTLAPAQRWNEFSQIHYIGFANPSRRTCSMLKEANKQNGMWLDTWMDPDHIQSGPMGLLSILLSRNLDLVSPSVWWTSWEKLGSWLLHLLLWLEVNLVTATPSIRHIYKGPDWLLNVNPPTGA